MLDAAIAAACVDLPQNIFVVAFFLVDFKASNFR
eukprot:CAMPEP_0172907646 /NCGR_PEP_ID=MMETSP1075-20121228/179277_1 /TAXON_ID=2916 /ORGANISM="Ceratium fusus, Strain PA161109" /LENGTH=33 /DNA_ID= /DNA_START= /DNA_END= /DNA_ORIENTATION=